MDGQHTDLWFRQTMCFRKVGGEWRIAHEHDSAA
jgi:ketosteroid isomerase-like protein